MPSLGACLVANDIPGIADAMIQARVEGKSWAQIAQEMNLPNPGAARKAFTKYTGLTDYKVKGPAVKKLYQDLASGATKVGEAAVKESIKVLDDAVKLKDDPIKIKASVNDLIETEKPWKPVHELASDTGLSTDTVEKISELASKKTGYTAIKQQTGATFDQIDHVVWNDAMKAADGKVWNAYKLKPTSETGFKAVQDRVLSLRGKGLSIEDISKLPDAPPIGVVNAIVKGEWKMPLAGSAAPVIPPPPPPPPVVYSGTTKASTGTNFRYHTTAEHRAWVNALGQDLSTQELAAVKRYTGSGYGEINSYLRHGLGGTNFDTGTGQVVQRIDRAMRPIPIDTQVTRQTSFSSAFKGVSKADAESLVGTVFEDKGFLSTTIEPGGVWSGDVKMIISVPKGAKGRYVRDISHHPHENELILARSTKMIVTKVERTTYGLTIHMEVIV